MHRRIGIILNRRNVGTNDRRITLFCADGKHELRARGTQKFESKLAGSLEPLTLVDVTTVRGRNGEQVTGSAIRDPYRALHASLPRLAAAGLIAASIDAVVHGWHDERLLLKRVREAFALIGRSRTNRQLLLSVGYGLWNLIAIAGYAPSARPGKATPTTRLIEVLVRGDVGLVRRIRCTVRTSRECIDAALKQLHLITDSDIPAARFFSYATHAVR